MGASRARGPWAAPARRRCRAGPSIFVSRTLSRFPGNERRPRVARRRFLAPRARPRARRRSRSLSRYARDAAADLDQPRLQSAGPVDVSGATTSAPRPRRRRRAPELDVVGVLRGALQVRVPRGALRDHRHPHGQGHGRRAGLRRRPQGRSRSARSRRFPSRPAAAGTSSGRPRSESCCFNPSTPHLPRPPGHRAPLPKHQMPGSDSSNAPERALGAAVPRPRRRGPACSSRRSARRRASPARRAQALRTAARRL
mmetsp:Transcript_27689/g.94260  ORF Transcript_27689/g.94260 Transcript_27689/m.94260 type:complete len:255 (-) Transcript_27689:173-937(-)